MSIISDKLGKPLLQNTTCNGIFSYFNEDTFNLIIK